MEGDLLKRSVRLAWTQRSGALQRTRLSPQDHCDHRPVSVSRSLATVLATNCCPLVPGWCVLRWRAEQIAVTDRRIIRLSGILTRAVDAAPLEQITDSTLRRSILGRILGFGSIRIETAGQKQALERMDFVPSPDALYRATLS